MITSWRLRQFKSLREREQMELRPLTLITGPNSSGKSSVLQSILLIVQTIGSKVPRRQLVLNGELIKLGTFRDLVHDGSDHEEIEIGFSLKLDPSKEPRRGRSSARAYIYPFFHRQETSIDVSVDLTFLPLRGEIKSETLHAILGRGIFSLSTTDNKSPRQTIRLQVRRRTPEEVADLIKSAAMTADNSRQSIDATMLFYEPEYSDPSAVEHWRRYYYPRINVGPMDLVSVVLDHFVPQYFINRYSLPGRRVIEAITDLAESGGSRRASSLLAEWEGNAQDSVRSALAKLIRTQGTDEQQSEYIKRTVSSFHAPSTVNDLAPIVDEITQSLDVSVQQQRAMEAIPPFEPVEMLQFALSQTFGDSIRYLGPLRDDPKPIYNIPTSADPSDIGIKGESTAAVLDLYAEQQVDYVAPADIDGPIIKGPLREAVRAWLKHFGIAESYSTQEEGKLGHKLTIQPQDISRSVDLTNVGVGVSQLLPIIVMSLIAGPDSVLLFEQPELHLHPRVQAQLGDFFLTMIRVGKQCLVETHSEYLINRIRRRVAEQPLGGTLSNDVLVYFTEHSGGKSVFRHIEINEYGAVPEWPKGFFDQGPTESDLILQAAQRKRKRRDEISKQETKGDA